MNNLHLVLGGPGCGKTTRLLQIMQSELEQGLSSTEIAFVTFNRDAADVARRRAAEKFELDPKRDLPWFRTIHSLAFASLGIQRDEIMDARDWAEFADVVNEELTGHYSSEDGAARGSRTTGDTLLRIVDYAGTTNHTLEDAWNLLDETVDWHRLKRFAHALDAYKEETGKLDFTDLLRRYPREGKALHVRVAIIDEAQDLTAAQWSVVRHAFQACERVYVAGDDDQAIYFWAGADVPQFLSLSTAPEVLAHSHRLPRAIHAAARLVAGRISQRYVKQFGADDRPGLVAYHQRPDAVDLSQDEWFVLARNNYLLKPLEAMIRDMGVNYTSRAGNAVRPTELKVMQLWERWRSGKQTDFAAAEYRALAKALERPKPQTRESNRYPITALGVTEEWAREHPWYNALTAIPPDRREFYLACLRRGERLSQPPRIRIDTIHGVKGDERNRVLLLSDMSHRTAVSYRKQADNEHRVFYVGMTRAKHELHIVMPQSDQSYPLA